MIGRVTGRLGYRATDHALIDAGGVGYVVYCSDRTLAALPAQGEFVSLFTEMVVREDAITLYGFLTLAEKEWHRLLTSVQGIGAKVGMAILGTLGADGVGRAISLGDVSAIKAAPGVGPKTANRVIMELRDKAPSVLALGAAGAAPAMGPADAGPPPAASPPEAPLQDAAAMASSPAPAGAPMAGARADALSALVNLGYGHGDAATALAQAEEAGETDTPGLIRGALRLLAPKG